MSQINSEKHKEKAIALKCNIYTPRKVAWPEGIQLIIICDGEKTAVRVVNTQQISRE